MGYDVTRFIGETSDEFNCSICAMVLEEPMQSPCDHLYCKKCIKGWLSARKTCPVDRRIMNFDDLKPAVRFFCNLLNGLKIKCDFYHGCQAVVVLEQLQKHIISCEHNPEAEIMCDKGCDLKITRREYQLNSCITHLKDHVRINEAVIKERSLQLIEQKEHFHLILSKLQQSNTKLSDEVSRQKVEITKLNTVRPQNNNLKFLTKWQKCLNMKIESDILEVVNLSLSASVQSFYCLHSANPSFKVKILSVDHIRIGLKGCFMFRKARNVEYRSDGSLDVMQTYGAGPAFKIGDIIECGINSPPYFTNTWTGDVQVYFTHNGQLIKEQLVSMPMGGFFPEIFMMGASKVEYLTN